MTTTAIGVDVGGTNVRAALVTGAGQVLATARAPSPPGDGDGLLDVIAATVRDVAPGDGTPPGPVGVGIAGSVTPAGVLTYSPNLVLGDLDVVGGLAARGLTVAAACNDASAAAWAEHRIGAAAGVGDVLLVTLGTGVGGGIVSDGRLLEGATGAGAELGHITIVLGGRRCPCGNDGCLEAYAAGPAMALGARSAPEVEAAARAGDAEALAHLQEVGRHLGVGLAALVNVLDPAVVVIGGGAGSHVFDLVAPVATETLATRMFGAERRDAPPVVPAALGDDAGVVGAALLALHRHADPRGDA